jgi:ribosomal protein S18 acetylase RimI-like enzyme
MIEYEIYTARDADGMVTLLSEAFTQREPLAQAVGITGPEFETFVRLLCPKADAERLTIVARHTGSGNLAGVLLTEDSASPPPDGLDAMGPKFEPIFDMLHGMEVEYRAGKTPSPGESLHLFLLGVAEFDTGQGIGHELVRRCLEHGARKGYRLAVTEATNPTSQHIFRQLGFANRVMRPYPGHRYNGEPVFRSIRHMGGAILMDKSLSDGG